MSNDSMGIRRGGGPRVFDVNPLKGQAPAVDEDERLDADIVDPLDFKDLLGFGDGSSALPAPSEQAAILQFGAGLTNAFISANKDDEDVREALTAVGRKIAANPPVYLLGDDINQQAVTDLLRQEMAGLSVRVPPELKTQQAKYQSLKLGQLHHRPVADKNAQFLGKVTLQNLQARPINTAPREVAAQAKQQADPLAAQFRQRLHEEVSGQLRALPSSGMTSDEDLNALMIIAMLEAANSSRADTKSIMDEMKAINAQRDRQRDESEEIAKVLARWASLTGSYESKGADYPADRSPDKDDWHDAALGGPGSILANADRVNGQVQTAETQQLEAQIQALDKSINRPVQGASGHTGSSRQRGQHHAQQVLEWKEQKAAAEQRLAEIRGGDDGKLGPGQMDYNTNQPQSLTIGMPDGKTLTITASSGKYLTKADLDVMKTQIDNEKDTRRNRIDSLSEVSETASLRMQMAMDRMSKLLQTLNNLVKKIGEGQQGTVQNMK